MSGAPDIERPSGREDALRQTWDRPAGIIGWLSQVNHKAIAVRYIVTTFAFFALAGIGALLMRTQLAQSNERFLSPETYNQLFTTHGTTMMFLFAIPVMEAVGMYFVPLMIGCRDMAFPRLNAFGYWVFLIAGTTLWVALLTGNGPNAAWFNYVPLSSKEYSPGIGIDIWTTAITFMEIATLTAAVEMIVTIFKLRAPGMSLNRMPLFVWSMLITSFMILFAMPTVMLASLMLALDRMVGTHFFDVAAGGDPLLWQHLFWIFGHPEVYIILIPGLGMISTIVATFARRSNAAYTLVTVSIVAIGFLSFGLWVHHMFTTGLPWLSLGLFSAASMTIAIPSGIQIFSWIATLWGTRPKFDTPMLFIAGFFIIFVIGGISGVMVAAIPFDQQVHDTYFVVAHFHYVLIGGGVFPLAAGLYYWFPKITGRMMSESLGKISFWTALIGFNVAFFPMHISGFMGMPRQVYTYQGGLGWDGPNMISTIGAYMFGLAWVFVLVNAVWSVFRGERAPANPWGAGTLEWSVPSPPPPYNFARIPTVQRQFPLWPNDENGPADPDLKPDAISDDAFSPHMDKRETTGTRLLDARLERKFNLAKPSIFPLLLALSVGVLFIGAIFSLWAVPLGAALSLIFGFAWVWPKGEEWSTERGGNGLTTFATGSGSHGWWAIVLLVMIEATVFTGLVASYFYYFSNATVWPPDGIDPPHLLMPTIYTLILLASVVPAYIADRSLAKGNMDGLKLWRAIASAMLVLFLALKAYEYITLETRWGDTVYGSIIWTIAGLHAAHVFVVLVKTLGTQTLAWKGFFNARRRSAVQGTTLYWAFVAAIWIPLYATIYLFPNFA